MRRMPTRARCRKRHAFLARSGKRHGDGDPHRRRSTTADPGHRDTYPANARTETDRLQKLSLDRGAAGAAQRQALRRLPRRLPVFRAPLRPQRGRLGHGDARDVPGAQRITRTPRQGQGNRRGLRLRRAAVRAGCRRHHHRRHGRQSWRPRPRRTGLEPGPRLYEHLITGLAQSLVDCLSANRVP